MAITGSLHQCCPTIKISTVHIYIVLVRREKGRKGREGISDVSYYINFMVEEFKNINIP